MFDVLRALGLTDLRNLSLLDAGCGNGVVSELVWAMGADVSGVDVSDDALRQSALRVPLGTFHRSPLMSFDLQREYDIVFCADVLYHVVDDADWKQALERLVRHTSPQRVQSDGLSDVVPAGDVALSIGWLAVYAGVSSWNRH